MKRPLSRWLARAATAVALTVIVPNVALAGPGTITPAKTDLTEQGGGWKVFLTVKLPKKPASPHQTFRFIFKRTVLYETYLDDAHGDAEQTRLVPTPDGDPQIESMDVNFANAKGEIWETTKLDFTILRDRGYEAGDYKVEVRDSDNRAVGNPFNLKLAGKNTVIDRRAMVMADPGKKKKKPEEKKEEKKEEPKEEKKEEGTPAEGATEKKEGEGAAAPPPVEKKAGGCGCTVPESSASGFAIPLALAGIAAVGLRRRRK